MEVKTIKGVDDETWARFKMLAAKKNLPMGKLLISMIKNYEKNSDEVWNKILNSGKIISDKEAEKMEKETKRLRKSGKWFRT